MPGYRALPIVPILEQLAGVEETVVRDKAVHSLNGILPLLLADTKPVPGKEEEEARQSCTKHAPGLVLAMIKRLAGADWFTAKISACAILPCVYQFFNMMKSNASVTVSINNNNNQDGTAMDAFGNTAMALGSGFDEGSSSTTTVDNIKNDLRNMYRALGEDDTPMVRRGASKHLAKYVEAVAKLPYGKSGANSGPIAKEFVIPGGKDETIIKKTVSQDLRNKVFEDVVPLYQTLCGDEQDSVRLLAYSASGSMGCALGLDGSTCKDAVLPLIKSGAQDLSWRVRHHLAKDFAIVAQSQGFHESSRKNELSQLFESFAGLLQDFEAQVRASAVENFARMAQLGGSDLFKSHMAPLLPNLADDPVMEVRSKLAQTIMDCCDDSICTALTDKVILQDFKPCIECFLNDEFAEVQLHILSKLSRVTRLLDQMDIVVQSIVTMSKNPNWRVRKAVATMLPYLAEARGVNFFQEQLLNVWMALLLDQVSDVRSSCVEGMPKLLSVTGPAFIKREIIPRYDEIYNESISYLTRITVLRSISRLAYDSRGLAKDLADDIVDHLLRGLSDRVVNVRLVAARGVIEISGVLDKSIFNAKLLTILEQIVTEDPDDDCKFYAQEAITAFSG